MAQPLASDVATLRWPAEHDRRLELSEAGVPRLLLVPVESGFSPPTPIDAIEDWVWMDACAAEVEQRRRALEVRAALLAPERSGPGAPTIDDDGIVRFGGSWVSVPPVEARLTAAMIERFGTVVARAVLTRAAWPTQAPGRNALDVHVLRLRRRLADVGLAVRTIRSRGYLLEADELPTLRGVGSSASTVQVVDRQPQFTRNPRLTEGKSTLPTFAVSHPATKEAT